MKVFKNRGGYIYVQYDEAYTKSNFIELMKEAYEKCAESGCKTLLVNVSEMKGTISTIDRFELGVQGALIFKNTFKIAVVYKEEEINQFAETVGINRGMNARVFGSMEKAFEWLGVIKNESDQ
jgi:hypothetical protein